MSVIALRGTGIVQPDLMLCLGAPLAVFSLVTGLELYMCLMRWWMCMMAQ